MTANRGPGAAVGRSAHLLVALVGSSLGRLWHAIGALAELISDAGHGPRRWREKSDIPNPYAGMGPIEADDTRPDD